ncbi:hypothetical protein D3C87_1821290 [compost metagenome]
MGRNRKTAQGQVADHVGDAAIEEDRTSRCSRACVGVQIAVQHQFGEQRAVAPRQGLSVDGLLATDDGAPRLGRGRMTRRRQRLDQAGLARAGAAGDEDAPQRCHASRVAIIM